MMEFAFLLAVVIAGMVVLTPIVGMTIYIITRPWLHAYAARQRCPRCQEERGG